MTSEEKKAYLLIKSVIFHYHGLDEDEQAILEETATNIQGHDELEWATQFIGEDYVNAFDRAKDYLSDVMMDFPPETRLKYICLAWDANNRKGYISEMEATAMLKLANTLGIQGDFLAYIKSSN
ncbi:hypothetical protein [Flammeovirga kamogawensis]|uniref:Co-chaperone DjlA N-terminal domain-containing protein n=1 Tax=Flammeovirga kamogawensis TaxID=373891 RepID=A0ABX8GR02_9BACT|nr:hypothetical protein [Flammeovirga kamogawensis]MBB6462778.1 hypothetical protein [Flammeovirga kamogawensis]QWG05994.1 hypothetical protein KM029_11525 [Flammeovirga kamogawensis]TRX67822.1 hypothetical protein EO216_06540 [Flammeovirga kamogawensis]